ncbi:MAG: MATE family efflux transporter [Rhodospirillales bacterium]
MLRRLSRDAADMVTLAVPISLGRIGIVLMTTVDFIMVGHFDSLELSYQSIGNAPVMPLVVIGLGLLSGTAILVANARGAGDPTTCGLAWRRSLPYSLVIGLFGLGICLFAEPLLLMSGQTPDLARNGGEVMRISGYGLPAFMLFLTTAFFLEGIGRPVPWMIVVYAGNVINLLGNWWLIEGGFGVDAMGAAGAAWATVGARWAVALTLIAYVLLNPAIRPYSVWGSIWSPWASWRQQRAIGFAASIGSGADSIAFAILTVFAGWLGPLPLAAFALTFNIMTMIYMVTLGIGSATAVRVGVAHGERNPVQVTSNGWLGLSLNTLVMLVFGVIVLFDGGIVAGIFTDDRALISIIEPMLALLSVILIVDGGQAILSNALRGCLDVWLPCAVQVTGYFVLMIPLAYYFAFSLGYGEMGLIGGFLVASTISCFLLILRFAYKSRNLCRAAEAPATA